MTLKQRDAFARCQRLSKYIPRRKDKAKAIRKLLASLKQFLAG